MIEDIYELNLPDSINNRLANYIKRVKTTGDVANLLLVGCPAMHISNITNIIAKEVGANIKEVDGSRTKPGDLARGLSNLKEGDIFCLKNISNFSSETISVFSQALRDYSLTITIGKGIMEKTVNLPIQKFCAVLFVENITQVPSIILEEFYHIIDFVKFQRELSMMYVFDFATKYNLNFTQSVMEEIIQCANDEQIKLKLIEVRNLAYEAGVTTITTDFLQGNLDHSPNLDKIEAMNGRQFELFTGKLFNALGYTNVTVTQSSHDFGADVIAEKDNFRFAIQCKRYSAPVGVSAVQEVIASKSLHDCHVACVLTNSTFTPAAIELAKKNLVILWDGKKLKEFIERTSASS